MTTGAVDVGHDVLSVCATADPGRHMVYDQHFRVSGDKGARIVDVTSQSRGVTINNYYIAIDPKPGIGVVDFPPDGRSWKSVIPATGADVPPNVDAFLITELTYTGRRGGSDMRTTVQYEVEGEKFSATFPNKFQFGRC